MSQSISVSDRPRCNRHILVMSPEPSLVLGVGLSWSHIRRAISGQADMDDVDE